MRFVSTRGESGSVLFSEAMQRGLAPDGGLYMPETIPDLQFDHLPKSAGIQSVARVVLDTLLEGDPLHASVPRLLQETFSFPIPLERRAGLAVLELFHGPTAAFKDVGARFMAAAYASLRDQTKPPDPDAVRTILVATSGDTGGAVASAFFRRAGFRVVILYPAGGVSPRQEGQLTGFGDNVEAYAVQGTFDDCQRMVKDTLGNAELSVRLKLTTANSINVARLLPQTLYYVWGSLAYLDSHGAKPAFVVPTGNVGNAVAALLAQRMGAPIEEVVLACNENRAVPDFFSSGEWAPRPSVATHANAMDVGDPSNMERLLSLYPDPATARRSLRALSVSDQEIESVIRSDRLEVIWDPHTATAVHTARVLEIRHPVVVATAHPAKFHEIVEPLVDRSIPIPPGLADLLARPSIRRELAPSSQAFEDLLAGSGNGRRT